MNQNLFLGIGPLVNDEVLLSAYGADANHGAGGLAIIELEDERVARDRISPVLMVC